MTLSRASTGTECSYRLTTATILCVTPSGEHKQTAAAHRKVPTTTGGGGSACSRRLKTYE